MDPRVGAHVEESHKCCAVHSRKQLEEMERLKQ